MDMNGMIDRLKEMTHERKAPAREKFRKEIGFSKDQFTKWLKLHHLDWKKICKKAGLETDHGHRWHSHSDDKLFNDMFRCFDETYKRDGEISTSCKQFEEKGRTIRSTYVRHWGGGNKKPWDNVLEGFKKELDARGEKPPWYDLFIPRINDTSINSRKRISIKDKQEFGDLINFEKLQHGPINEHGVVLLFGMIFERMGFCIEKVQAKYPDCLAKRLNAKGKWEPVRIEFEFKSKSFKDHIDKKQSKRGDIIVCWEDNWKGRPSEFEVIELKKEIERLRSKPAHP